MILIDTSVLINFFRGRETSGTKYLENLINEELDKINPSIEEIYEPIGEEIEEKVKNQNQLFEKKPEEKEKKEVKEEEIQ